VGEDPRPGEHRSGGAGGALSTAAPDVDRGSTSLTVVLLTPVVVVLMFAGFQAALWNHARAEARSVARDVAALVARDGLPVGQAIAAAQSALTDTALTDPQVSIDSTGGRVRVSISGRAPGILRGTSSAVAVHADLPVEGWVPL